MSSLEVFGLSKRFGKIEALKDVSFQVNDGEFMVVLGPTAAGKTTTLRCIAGLEKLDSGTVLMDGENVASTSPAERDVAFVFQTYALYPRKTAYENMAFPLQAREISKKDIDNRVREIASLLQITELLDRRPANMSGGQQQRVALGRAMVRQPRMFLMDEPLTNLDFKLRVEMRAELKRLQRELDITFFYVTNDQVEAMTMADRIAVLNQGVIQQIDTPENIYNHPANLFVAQFVGNPRMTVIDCFFDADERKLIANDQSWTITPTDAQLGKLTNIPSPKKLNFGVRAEDIIIKPHGKSIKGEIYVLEPLGDRTFVDIALKDYSIKARAEPDFKGQTGDSIEFMFDIERTHVFDAVTQQTIY